MLSNNSLCVQKVQVASGLLAGIRHPVERSRCLQIGLNTIVIKMFFKKAQLLLLSKIFYNVNLPLPLWLVE